VEGKSFPLHLGKGESLTVNLDTLAGSHSFEVRVAVPDNRNSNGIGKKGWQLVWADRNQTPLRKLSVRWGNERLGDPTDRRYMLVCVDSIDSAGAESRILEKKLFEGVNLYGGWNTLSVEENFAGAEMWIGDDMEYSIGKLGHPSGAASVTLEGTGKTDVEYFAYVPVPDPAVRLHTGWTEPDLISYLKEHASGPEGLWQFLDRDTNARWAEPGGTYLLAIVRHDSDKDVQEFVPGGFRPGRYTRVYDVIYLDDARVNSRNWKPGMLKGQLYSTIFENHYQLVWFDAGMELIDEELSADMIDGAIVSFNFPLLHSIMRFARVPMKHLE